MDNEKKAGRKIRKEELQREKMLNHSMVAMSRATQQSAGIVSIQPEDGVFYIGNWNYLKIYSVQFGDISGKKKESLVKVLCGITMLRMRITSIRRVKEDVRLASPFFLTVYLKASGYADAKRQLDGFEKQMEDMLVSALGIKVAPCSIEDAVMLIRMNSTEKMEAFTYLPARNKENWDSYLFPLHVEEREQGLYLPDAGQYVQVFAGVQYPERLMEPYDSIYPMQVGLISCVDMQVMGKEETGMFDYTLEQKYNYTLDKAGQEADQKINLTYMLGIVTDNEKKMDACREMIVSRFRDKDVTLSTFAGDSRLIYRSLYSFGLVDYHAMRNTNPEVIAELML